MNKKNQKIFRLIFTEPVLKNIEWRKIESFFSSIGCEIIEGRGSRVAFRLKNDRADFHRPHPGKEAKEYQIKAVREFINKIGVKL